MKCALVRINVGYYHLLRRLHKLLMGKDERWYERRCPAFKFLKAVSICVHEGAGRF